MMIKYVLTYCKRIIKFFSPILFVFIYYLFTHDDIEQRKQELYFNIPEIKVYASDVPLKESLIVDGRTTTVVTGIGSFKVTTNGRVIKDYYEGELKRLGWKEVNYKIQKNREGVHFADRFYFKKGEYILVFMIYPPLFEYDNMEDIETYLKIVNAKYNISFGKEDVIR